jgi:hypothetical protein
LRARFADRRHDHGEQASNRQQVPMSLHVPLSWTEPAAGDRRCLGLRCARTAVSFA